MVTSRIAALLVLMLLWCAAGSQAQPLARWATPGPTVAETAEPAALVLPGDGPVIGHAVGDPSTSVGAETASDVPADLGALNAVPELPVTLGAPGDAQGPSHASPCLDGPRRPPR